MSFLIRLTPDFIRHFLDRTPMYRVVTLLLLTLAGISILLGAFGVLVYGAVAQLVSLLVAVSVALVLNVLFAKGCNVHAQHESAVITGLLLFFLFIPTLSLQGIGFLAAAVVVAISSKFLLAPGKQHIFNAAAFGAAVLSVPGIHEAWWWIAQPEMLIPLLIAGAMVVSKVRKWPMVLTFIAVGSLVYVVEGFFRFDTAAQTSLYRFLVTGPALFLGFFMLTEPFSTPPTQRLQVLYGAGVGALMSTSLFMGYVPMTPELALLVGNLAVYPFMMRRKYSLVLEDVQEISESTFELTFHKPESFTWQPGQYVEWMLPHEAPDKRGERRYFTIASAPEEQVVRLALRYSGEEGSSYKKALLKLEPGDEVLVSQLAGDFMLPAETDTKLAWIAGGIGATPFRAHVGEMESTRTDRDVIFFYCNKQVKEIAYRETFAEAKELGVRTVHVLQEPSPEADVTGFLTEQAIKDYAPDYQERTWYISGPPGMVSAYQELLRGMGVSSRHIVTDFFPGLA